jgi:hypothetical protein
LHEISRKYLKAGLKYDIKKYVDEGRTIVPDKDALGPCCKLVWKRMKDVEKKKEFEVPQYVLNKEYFDENKQECLQWFEK